RGCDHGEQPFPALGGYEPPEQVVDVVVPQAFVRYEETPDDDTEPHVEKPASRRNGCRWKGRPFRHGRDYIRGASVHPGWDRRDREGMIVGGGLPRALRFRSRRAERGA